MTAEYTGPFGLMEDVATAIAADVGVSFAVHELYGNQTSLSFFLGVNSTDMPEISHAPFVAMMPGDYSRAPMDEYKNLGVRLALVVTNKNTDTTVPKITKLKGILDLEILVQKINVVIKELFKEKLGRYMTWGQIQTDVFFPEFRATWSVDAKDEI